jgi:hypothetical protein
LDKISLLTLGITLRDFVSPRLPRGVSADLLWDLWDICIKWGQYREEVLVLKETPLIMGIRNVPSNDIEFAIASTTNSGSDHQLSVTRFVVASGIAVEWDVTLDPVTVRECIRKIDDVSRDCGLMKNNIRSME